MGVLLLHPVREIDAEDASVDVKNLNLTSSDRNVISRNVIRAVRLVTQAPIYTHNQVQNMQIHIRCPPDGFAGVLL